MFVRSLLRLGTAPALTRLAKHFADAFSRGPALQHLIDIRAINIGWHREELYITYGLQCATLATQLHLQSRCCSAAVIALLKLCQHRNEQCASYPGTENPRHHTV